MEIEFDDGGCVNMATGPDARTTLEIFRVHPGQVRIALDARASHGEMSLGVGLTPEQARQVGCHLLSLADEIDTDTNDQQSDDDDDDGGATDLKRGDGGIGSTTVSNVLEDTGVDSGYGIDGNEEWSE